jgi:hypothetical protein
MPKGDVLKKFSDAGFTVRNMNVEGDPADGKLLTAMRKDLQKTDPARLNVFAISFTAGHLSFAQRSWLDDTDPLRSVVEAFGAVTSHDSRECTITYSPITSPSGSTTRVFIDCGKRSLLIMRGDIEFKGSKLQHLDVEERIGIPPE